MFGYQGAGVPGGVNVVDRDGHLFRVGLIVGAAYRYIGAEIGEHVLEEFLHEPNGTPYGSRQYDDLPDFGTDGDFEVIADWTKTEQFQNEDGSYYYVRTSVETTIILKFAKNTFTMTFDGNGGGEMPPPVTFKIHESVDLPRTARRRHYKLLGWDEDKTARWPRYSVDSPYLRYYPTAPNNVTLYAIWKCIFTYLPVRTDDGQKIVIGKDNKIIRHGDE